MRAGKSLKGDIWYYVPYNVRGNVRHNIWGNVWDNVRVILLKIL